MLTVMNAVHPEEGEVSSGSRNLSRGAVKNWAQLVPTGAVSLSHCRASIRERQETFFGGCTGHSDITEKTLPGREILLHSRNRVLTVTATNGGQGVLENCPLLVGSMPAMTRWLSTKQQKISAERS